MSPEAYYVATLMSLGFEPADLACLDAAEHQDLLVDLGFDEADIYAL